MITCSAQNLSQTPISQTAIYPLNRGFPGGAGGKEPVCDAGDVGSISGSGRSPGERNGNPLRILAWEIPWTEEPGGLQSMGSQRVRHD